MAQRYKLGDGLASLFMSMDEDVSRDAYESAMLDNLKRDKLGQEVTGMRSRNKSREGLADAFEAMGFSHPEAAATVVLASDSFNPAQVGDYQGDLLTREFLTGARENYDAGNTERANFMLRAGGRAPLEMTDVQGGVAFNPNRRPGDTPMIETPAHQAEVSADLAGDGGFQPLTGTLADAFTEPVLGKDGEPLTNPITGEVAMQFDAEGFRDFQRWHRTSGIPDQNQALAVYLSQSEPHDAGGEKLPAAARAKLREGVITTFANGQRWTLQDGVPARVE
jgi:hypothetical protein